MDVVSLPCRYASSLWWNFRHPGVFKAVNTFILFIGYPRSGHSLIGFLLDAHPDVVVASQTSSLKYLKHGFTKHQIFQVLLQDSVRVAKIGREWRLYSYDVPNQWQGRFNTLTAIGDSTGLSRLRRNPSLISALQKRLGEVSIKLIHCIRNPYDNISTMTMRRDVNPRRDTVGLAHTAERYFNMCEAVERITRQVGPSAVYDLRHEAMIARPRDTLRSICAFLGLTGSESYYRDCASIVYPSPRKSRFEMSWNSHLIETVKERLQRFSFLQDYSYDEEPVCFHEVANS